jgi:hypothetical protein
MLVVILVKIEAELHKSLTEEDVNCIMDACDIITSLYSRLFNITITKGNFNIEVFYQPVSNTNGSLLGKFVIAEEILENLMNNSASPIKGLFADVVFFSKTDNLFPIVAYGCDSEKKTGSFIISVDALRTENTPIFVKRIAVNFLHSVGMIAIHTKCHNPGCPLNYHARVEDMDNSKTQYCESCLHKMQAYFRV